MAIRAKNLDQRTRAMKGFSQRHIGDAGSASVYHALFVAPHACTVERVEIYTNTSNVGNTSQSMVLSILQGSGAGVQMGAFIGPVVGSAVNIITMTSNYNLSQGTIVWMNVSATCQTISNVIATTVYTYRRHQESR